MTNNDQELNERRFKNIDFNMFGTQLAGIVLIGMISYQQHEIVGLQDKLNQANSRTKTIVDSTFKAHRENQDALVDPAHDGIIDLGSISPEEENAPLDPIWQKEADSVRNAYAKSGMILIKYKDKFVR